MATQNFENNIWEVSKALQENGVQYLVVGGTAIAFYGYIRPTTTADGTILDTDDFDFWYKPSYPNYKSLLKALKSLGIDTNEFEEEEFPNVKSSFFRFKLNDFSVDFLPKVAGNLNFLDCYERRMISNVNQIEIAIIALHDLLISKKETGRKKDLSDVEELEKMIRKKQ